MTLKIKTENILFYLAYSLYFMALMTENLSVDNMHTVKQILVFMSVGILFIDYMKKYLLGHVFGLRFSLFVLMLSIVAFLVIYMAVTTKDYYLIAVVMLAVGMRKLDMKEFFRISFVILLFLTTIVVLSSVIGIIPMVSSVRKTAYNHGGVRYAMGFKGGLFLPNIIVYCVCYYYSFKGKMKLIDFIFFQILGIIVFLLCDSRNGMIALEIMYVFLLFWKISKKSDRLKKMIGFVASISFSLIAILSIYLLNAYKIKTALSVIANDILSGRLWAAMMNSFSSPFEWIHFESSIQFMENLKYAYDNGYYFVMARYGYIMLILLCIVVFFICKYMQDEDNYTAILGLIVVGLLNFIDNGLISYGFLPYILIGIYSMFRYMNNYISTHNIKGTLGFFFRRFKI